jgi:hypothetical protein
MICYQKYEHVALTEERGKNVSFKSKSASIFRVGMLLSGKPDIKFWPASVAWQNSDSARGK